AYGDAVFGNPAKTEDDPRIQGARDVVDVFDWLGHAPLGPAHAYGKGFNAQAVDAYHAEAFIEQVMCQRVARRPHADHQNILAVVGKRKGTAEIEGVPAGQERVNFKTI